MTTATQAPPCGHQAITDGCSLCDLARRDARYMRLWFGKAVATAVPQVPTEPAMIAPPCFRRSAPTGETTQCGTCRAGTRIKLFGCSLHQRCTIDRQSNDLSIVCCSACREREAAATNHPRADDGQVLTVNTWAPAEWVSTARLAADSVLLAGLLPADTIGVIGVPRSGMVPAAIVAAHLHLPLYDLSASGPRAMGAGSRGGELRRASTGRLAVIDDTVYAGGAMRRAREALRGLPAVYAAVYCRPEARRFVDVAARELPCPHVLEWNLVNCGVARGSAANKAFFRAGVGLDLDGVIVHDEKSAGLPGSPYLVPRAFPVPLIATGRKERHRGRTEALLRSLGVRWAKLEMLPDHVSSDGDRIAEHKARHFAAHGLGLFVESDPAQAEMIHRLSGLPVACPIAGTIFQRPVA